MVDEKVVALVNALLDECGAHFEAGHLQEAAEAAHSAQDLALERLPAMHTLIAQAIRASGILQMELENYDRARGLLTALHRRFAQDDPRGAIALGDLANLALAQQQHSEAERLLRLAIEQIEQAEETGVALVPLLGALASLRAVQPDGVEEAALLAARALDILITEAGEQDIAVADTMMFCALLDLRSARPRGASALARQALSIYEAQEAPAERRAVSLRLLAEALLMTGKREEAQRAQRSARALWSEEARPSFEREFERFRAELRALPRRPRGRPRPRPRPRARSGPRSGRGSR